MAGLNNQVFGELDPAHRPPATQSVFLSEHSEQNENSNLGQKGDAHDCDGEKYVARR